MSGCFIRSLVRTDGQTGDGATLIVISQGLPPTGWCLIA